MKVLDASAFINSRAMAGGNLFTVSSVLREVRDVASRTLMEQARSDGRLSVTSPSPESLAAVKEKAGFVGSLAKLSLTDLDVLALAYEKKATLVTDDYTMQNVAAHMGVPFEGAMRGAIQKKKSFRFRA